jgi:SAM-dependent methyltransferase
MTDLASIVGRARPPEPWAEGDKIPWSDPAFSERMLAEHLSQAHEAASRRSGLIEAQVVWLHENLMSAEPGRVLDLGCGPGLYATRLAALGHSVTGLDFSPASIRHARSLATDLGVNATFELADIRNAGFGTGYDLVMLIYGELNVFTRPDGASILGRAYRSLRPGGRLLIEPHTLAAVEAQGRAAPTWRTAERGLFSERPHLLLEESFWDEAQSVATHRWFVVDAASGEVARHVETMQGYRDDEYDALLEEAGFGDVARVSGWPEAAAHAGVLFALTARR